MSMLGAADRGQLDVWADQQRAAVRALLVVLDLDDLGVAAGPGGAHAPEPKVQVHDEKTAVHRLSRRKGPCWAGDPLTLLPPQGQRATLYLGVYPRAVPGNQAGPVRIRIVMT
jgi:hypothetical protein